MDVPHGRKKTTCKGLVDEILRKNPVENGYLDIYWKSGAIVEYRGTVVLKDGSPILAEVKGVGVHLKGDEALNEILSHYCRKVEVYELPKEYVEYVLKINQSYTTSFTGGMDGVERKRSRLSRIVRRVISLLKRDDEWYEDWEEETDWDTEEEEFWDEREIRDVRNVLDRLTNGVRRPVRRPLLTRGAERMENTGAKVVEEAKDEKDEEEKSRESVKLEKVKVDNLEKFISQLSDFTGTVFAKGDDFEGVLVMRSGEVVAARVSVCGEEYQGVSALYYLDYPCLVELNEEVDINEEWVVKRNREVLGEIYSRLDEVVVDRSMIDDIE